MRLASRTHSTRLRLVSLTLNYRYLIPSAFHYQISSWHIKEAVELFYNVLVTQRLSQVPDGCCR